MASAFKRLPFWDVKIHILLHNDGCRVSILYHILQLQILALSAVYVNLLPFYISFDSCHLTAFHLSHSYALNIVV